MKRKLTCKSPFGRLVESTMLTCFDVGDRVTDTNAALERAFKALKRQGRVDSYTITIEGLGGTRLYVSARKGNKLATGVVCSKDEYADA